MPLKDSLDALVNVAELGPLSDAYRKADFSNTLRPTKFLRK